jgi:glycosyltransferase involved in cell wall biosynthesis
MHWRIPILKTRVQVDKKITKEVRALRSSGNVCMHVRGVARTDGRVMREATALKDAGFVVTILDIENDLTRPVEEDIRGIHVRHIIKPDWLIPVHFGLRRFIRSTQKFVYTTLQLIHTPTDVYHAHDDNALIPCSIAALWHRKPLVFDAHEFPLSCMRGYWLKKVSSYLFVLIVKRCSGVITVSSPIAQEICKLYHLSEVTLVRNIPVYQQPLTSDRLRQFLNLGPDVRIALYQGYLQEDRSLDTLVRAATFLEENIVLVLMGKGVGAMPARLEAIIAEEGLGKQVRIIPPVPYTELLEWTASADIGLIVYAPDYSINIQMCLPNKLFEYLMAGLPVLASQLDAIADILRTYEVGRIVPSLAPSDIGTAINTIMAESASRAYMHKKALSIVKNELCWEKECQHLVQLYQRILGR